MVCCLFNSLCFPPVVACCSNFFVCPVCPDNLYQLYSLNPALRWLLTLQNAHRKGAFPPIISCPKRWMRQALYFTDAHVNAEEPPSPDRGYMTVFVAVIPQTSPSCLKHVWLLSNKVWLTK